MIRSAILVTFFLLALAFGSVVTRAQTASTCLLSQPTGSDSALYRWRGNRCEGVVPENYAIEPSIQLRAYFEGDPSVDFKNRPNNLIRIPGLVTSRVTRQIVVRTTASAGRARNYMMDTYVTGPSFEWSTEIARGRLGDQTGSSLLGYACMPRCGAANSSYLPLAISPGAQSPSNLRYFMLSIPSSVREMTVALERTGTRIELRKDTGPFSPSSPVSVLVRPNTPSGNYFLTVRGKSKDGGPVEFSAAVVIP